MDNDTQAARHAVHAAHAGLMIVAFKFYTLSNIKQILLFTLQSYETSFLEN